MTFMSRIIDGLNAASSYFYNVYLEVLSWPDPFWRIYAPFYFLSTRFNDLAWAFYDFSVWVNNVQSQVASILSWDTIWSYILSYVPNLVAVRDWFYNWWYNVTSVVTSWWSTTQNTVLAWVQGAKDMATSLFNQVSSSLASLQAAWDGFKGKVPSIDELIAWWGNWWGNVLAQLGSWWNDRLLEVQSLIDSAFLARASLWAGWQEMRAQVTEFFDDPLEWLWSRTADWFLGPEG